MILNPEHTTDTNIREFLEELQNTPKRDLRFAYSESVGGDQHVVGGATKEMMIRRIVGYAIQKIGEYEDDGKMDPASLVINRFSDCPEPNQ